MSSVFASLNQIHACGVRWSLVPGLAVTLLDDAGLRLPEWLRAGHAHIVKQGPHRVVYSVNLPGLSFHLKHNRVTDSRSWFRQLLRPSKARVEFASTLAVAARGVPTVAPLALGEQPAFRGGESFLITRSLHRCEPLNNFLARTLPELPRGEQTRVRQRLADEMGRLVAQIHDAGIRHNDFHAGNILVRLSGEQIELYLIDLNSVCIGAPLNWSASIENLAMLNSWFVLRVSRADRLRFWKAYFLARAWGSWGKGQYASRQHLHLAETIEQRTWRANLTFWRRRDARCMKDNRYYRRVAGPRVAGHAVAEMTHASLAPLLADPDEPFRRPDVRLLKSSPSSTVAELEIVVDGRRRRVIYKRFRAIAPLEPLASLVRRTPALRSWVHGQGFRERGLPTARTLAVLHRTRWGMQTDGYLLTEKVENSQELHAYLSDLKREPMPRRLELLCRQIDRVARTISALHERHLSHRDLKAANILVRRIDAPPIEPDARDTTAPVGLLHMPEASVWFIDLVGVELFRILPRRRKVQNLARLNASFHHRPELTRTDRLRFLRAYLNWGLRGQGDWKGWWKAIQRATQEKVARNLRRKRPLE